MLCKHKQKPHAINHHCPKTESGGARGVWQVVAKVSAKIDTRAGRYHPRCPTRPQPDPQTRSAPKCPLATYYILSPAVFCR